MDIVLNETRLRVYRNGDIYRWRCNKKNGVNYVQVKNTANANYGYNQIKCNKKRYLRHRIMGYCFLGLDIDDPKQQIDHIDRIKLNNHVSNLRIVTSQQNCFNKGAKGYYWNKKANKWQSSIALNGKSTFLGLFDTEDDAHNAYLDAKEKYHNFYE
jgi:hypothetical protein